MPVPIAIIVCEGDLETIAHIADALQNKLPVIIMKGSGKAADLIVDYLQRCVHSCRKNILQRCKDLSNCFGVGGHGNTRLLIFFASFVLKFCFGFF